MITSATFLLTDITFHFIASQERTETNKHTISQSSCRFGRKVSTFWQHLWPPFVGPSILPRRWRQQISLKRQHTQPHHITSLKTIAYILLLFLLLPLSLPLPTTHYHYYGLEYLSRYSDWLRAGRSGDGIPVGARFSSPVQTGPGAHPASCTMGIGSLPGVKRPGRGVDNPPHLAPKLKKE
jgi:hypothetical protein